MQKSEYSASQSDIISFCDAIDESRAVMTDRDKHVYNILSRSTPSKPTFSSLGLHEAEKTGRLQKTGPCPRWYSAWRKREFSLKGNFLYYYKPNSKNNDNSVVLGAAYVRGAAIDTTKMKGSRHVIVITPPVARRAGWKDDETSVFYIKCKDETEVTDWYRALKEVANYR